MSAETVVVSHIVRHGNDALAAVLDAGITIEYFGSERTSGAFAWIVEQWSLHAEVPSEERFSRRFPNFRLSYDPDPLASLIGDLKAHHARNVARDLLPPVVRELEKPDHEMDIDVVVGGLGEMQQRIALVRSASRVALLSEQMSTFLDELLSMEGGEVPGIPTGFDTLDVASGGWQPENFAVIGAGPKRFKTAILVWMALAAAKAGYYVDFITFEMSIHELLQRIYCLGAQVNYTHILRGTLTKGEKRKLAEYRDAVKSWEGEVRIVHEISAVTTLSGLTSKVRTSARKPDAVYVDGLYQMTDDTRSHDSESAALTAVSRGIKRLAAQEGIAVVGTTQALLSRISPRKGTTMGSLGYTSAFAQDANVIITIDRFDMGSNEIVVTVAGARAMAGMAINVTVDLETGTIFEGAEVTESGGGGGVDDY